MLLEHKGDEAGGRWPLLDFHSGTQSDLILGRKNCDYAWARSSSPGESLRQGIRISRCFDI